MVVMAVMTTLCTAGIVFYLRFLVALCKECKRSWIGYLVRLEPEANDYSVLEPQALERSFHKAA
jgi:hypothetical protein